MPILIKNLKFHCFFPEWRQVHHHQFSYCTFTRVMRHKPRKPGLRFRWRGRQHGLCSNRGSTLPLRLPRALLAAGRSIPARMYSGVTPEPGSTHAFFWQTIHGDSYVHRGKEKSASVARAGMELRLAISISATVHRGEPEEGARLCPERPGESSVPYRFPRCGRRQHRPPVRG